MVFDRNVGGGAKVINEAVGGLTRYPDALARGGTWLARRRSAGLQVINTLEGIKPARLEKVVVVGGGVDRDERRRSRLNWMDCLTDKGRPGCAKRPH